MSFIALKTFIGVNVKARKGELVTINNEAYAQALIEGGYISDAKAEPEATKAEGKAEPVKKKKTRTRKKEA
jgi:hypothetical protein